MNFHNLLTASLTLLLVDSQTRANEPESNLLKLCLFYESASGHARSDPILNQECASDHVHTFYGPSDFHPNTSYEQLVNTKPEYSSTPFEENQSLYWHPSIYEVTGEGNSKTYTRVSNLDTSPYYRWDMTNSPETVAFPPEFRMIAYSNADGANGEGDIGGEGGSLLVECCVDAEDDCTNTYGNQLIFPNKKCDVLGIAFAMPTCWDESKGIGIDNPFDHVAYTTNAKVNGPCPAGYDKRIPQIQLFIRIRDYRGDIYSYQLSDGSDIFHVDFMNGWKEGKLQEVLDGCETAAHNDGYNPECHCDQMLTPNDKAVGAVCDDEVKQYVLDEETEVVATALPRGTCEETPMIEKSWNQDPPYSCFKELYAFQDGESEDGEAALPRGTCEETPMIEKSWNQDPPYSCFKELYAFQDGESEDGEDEDEEDYCCDYGYDDYYDEGDRKLRKKHKALKKVVHVVSFL